MPLAAGKGISCIAQYGLDELALRIRSDRPPVVQDFEMQLGLLLLVQLSHFGFNPGSDLVVIEGPGEGPGVRFQPR